MQFVEANGARIPLIGLGTWELRGRTCARIVEQALRLGYRHIDTAEMYDNEREVGRGAARLRRQARRGLRHHQDMAVAFRAARAGACRQGQPGRGCDCPTSTSCCCTGRIRRSRWPRRLARLCKVKQAGLARHIGVSNFTVPLIEEAVRLASEPLVCNQIEMHPYLDQSKVTCRLPGAWHGGRRLQPDRPRRRQERRGARAHRQGARQDARPRSACAGWCSRASWSFRAPAGSSAWRRIRAIFDFELTAAEMREIAALGASRRPPRRLRLFRVAEVGLTPRCRHRAVLRRPGFHRVPGVGAASASRASRPSASTTGSGTGSSSRCVRACASASRAARGMGAATGRGSHGRARCARRRCRTPRSPATSRSRSPRTGCRRPSCRAAISSSSPSPARSPTAAAPSIWSPACARPIISGYPDCRDDTIKAHAGRAQPRHGPAVRDPYAADVDRQGGDLRARARHRRRRLRRSAGRGHPHLLSRRPLAAA